MASVRGSRRSWVRTRAAVANVIRALTAAVLREREKRLLDVAVAGARAELVRRLRGDDASAAHQHELVAALGLVHDVARDEQRRAAVGECVELRPELGAQHRVEADGRLVEDEHLRVAEKRRGEGDA